MSDAAAWQAPPERPRVGPEDVDIWRVSTLVADTANASLQRILSGAERERARRFRFERDRRGFTVARGAVRTILGMYLGRAPETIGLVLGPYGKPALAPAHGQPDLRFNVSRTHGMALVAVALSRDVGVDIERVREDFASDEIAERFFTPAEAAAIRTLPGSERSASFFRTWTRKEAYVKARGQGLSMPLDQFTVSTGAAEPGTLLVSHDAEETGQWSLLDLRPGPGLIAALAVEGHDWRARLWQWPGSSELAGAALSEKVVGDTGFEPVTSRM